ncbi:MAG: DUF429 domain-containing protein [Deltaproteobacteria bacterium]|jgi:hypothetical protein
MKTGETNSPQDIRMNPFNGWSWNPTAIYGIDFSGALLAGRKIWISLAVIKGGVLEIKNCFRGLSLPNSGRRLPDCLEALVTFIASHKNSIFGFDFPFGLPRQIAENIGCENWTGFISAFPHEFNNPHEFRYKCQQVFAKPEAKRTTDRESHTPFSPYNLRLFKQTYFGITGVLYPLLKNVNACVVPMQKVIDDRPLILEICPKSTLVREKIAIKKYKGKTKKHFVNRQLILNRLSEKAVIIPKNLSRSILADAEGDALDSVIAAYTVGKSLLNPTFPFPAGWKREYAIEGYVYS